MRLNKPLPVPRTVADLGRSWLICSFALHKSSENRRTPLARLNILAYAARYRIRPKLPNACVVEYRLVMGQSPIDGVLDV